MNREYWRACAWLLPAIAGLISNGCTTSALWRGDLVESYHEPSGPNQTAFFVDQKKQDVLVRYVELTPWGDKPRVRAYYVRQNADRLQERRRPRFERPAAANRLEPLPLYIGAARPDVPPQMWVVASEKGNEFTIYRDKGPPEGPYELPVYRGKSGNFKLALMTPATVAVDTSIVGGILAYVWLNEGCPGLRQ
jgi:hypothetical protein